MAVIANTAAGPRGLHTEDGFVMVEVGASITTSLSAAERASAKATGYFDFGDDDADAADGDDLTDMKVAELRDVAAAERVDLGDARSKADIQVAIRTARNERDA